MSNSPRFLRSLLAIWLVCLLAAIPAFAADLVAIPPLQARVTDMTATLTSEQRATLDGSLENFERERGSQISILLLPTTQPEAIEQFGIRLAEAWKIGRKGIDDGVIVIVAKNDRRVRLEVGYGLEGALNDATAKRIISETMTPRFKSGDYYGGLQSGVTAILGVISGEALPAARAAPALSALADRQDVLVIALVAVVLIGSCLRMILGNLLGASITAAGAGAVAWLLSTSLLAVLIAAGAGFLLSLFGLNIAWGILMSRGGGGFGGRSGGGGGFGGGGGGGFGGGGASGGW
jgi:uncharacterized protein